MTDKKSQITPQFTIAEVGMNHDGSLGTAIKYIHALKGTGVSAVKFQAHLPEFESSSFEEFRVNAFPQDKTRYDYWKRTSFEFEEWRVLCEEAKNNGLIFFATPFSVEAVEMLSKLDVKIWKIASGEVSNWYLLDSIIDKGGDIIMSSGMSSIQELDQNVEYIKKKNGRLKSVLQCTSAYPVDAHNVGLNLVSELSERYNTMPGISDHSGRTEVSMVASFLGCEIFEFHVRLSELDFGPDISSSIDVKKLKQLIGSIQYSKNLSSPVIKDKAQSNLLSMRDLFCPKLVAKKSLQAGENVVKSDFISRKGNTGIKVADLQEVLGLKVKNEVKAGSFLEWSDLEKS